MEQEEVNVYLSYNEDDTRLVSPLYVALTRRGLSCWFWDHEQLRQDSAKLPRSERLRAARAVLVCVGPNGIGAGQHERELESAFSLAASGALHMLSVLLPGAKGWETVPTRLRNLRGIDLREGLDDSRIDELAAHLRSDAPITADPMTEADLLRLAFLRTLDGRLKLEHLLDDAPGGALRRSMGLEVQTDGTWLRAELTALAQRYRNPQPSELWLAWAACALARDT